MKTDRAAAVAEQAADQAIAAAEAARKFSTEAGRDRQRVEELAPDPHQQMIAALASEEGNARLRIGPKRNRWRDLQAFEEELVAIEQRRSALLDELASARADLNNEPARHAVELGDWFGAGETGERPLSRAAEIEQRIGELDAEYRGLGVRHGRVLVARAEHVARNRRKMAGDVAAEKEQKRSRLLEVIDEAAALRQELLALRATEVWLTLYPNDALMSEPNTQALVGGLKRLQQPHLPAVEAGLVAEGVFALLREDARFCAEVATVDQAAAEQGTTANTLTGRVGRWLNEGGVDFVGPRFDAAWGGSPEEKQEAAKAAAYSESQRRRVWGES